MQSAKRKIRLFIRSSCNKIDANLIRNVIIVALLHKEHQKNNESIREKNLIQKFLKSQRFNRKFNNDFL